MSSNSTHTSLIYGSFAKCEPLPHLAARLVRRQRVHAYSERMKGAEPPALFFRHLLWHTFSYSENWLAVEYTCQRWGEHALPNICAGDKYMHAQAVQSQSWLGSFMKIYSIARPSYDRLGDARAAAVVLMHIFNLFLWAPNCNFGWVVNIKGWVTCRTFKSCKFILEGCDWRTIGLQIWARCSLKCEFFFFF